MGKTHTIRFEPLGIEMEADEDETILNAAFRQGLMLMHGCKEGQCSACKSFLLDGEVDLDRYSTFALPDFEEAEGWTLLCRAHAYSDLEIELIHYDEEVLHAGSPPRTVATRVTAVEELTRDIRLLRLAVEDSEPFSFKPGQYVDIRIPGQEDEHRSFSMARPASAAPEELEFMIKLYRGGHFSGLLAEGAVKPGDVLLRGAHGGRPLPRRRARGPLRPAPGAHVRPGALGGRAERLGGRDGPDHGRRRAARGRPLGRRRVPLRAAPDGRRGHRDARGAGRARGAHLLRQVHHDRAVREERPWQRTPT